MLSGAARREEKRLKNLDQAVEASGEIKDDVVDPLKSTAVLAGSTTVHGLGVAGSALGGVNGVGVILAGVRARDPRVVLAGIAETTTAAAGLALVGVIGGATWLAPVGAGLLLMRAGHRVLSDERAARLDGAVDGFAATAMIASTLHASPAVTLGLGLGAAAVGGLRGLHRLHVGHDDGDPRLRIRGTGEIVSSIGLATLLAGAPGMALVFGGASLSLLQRVPSLRPYIDRGMRGADRVLYPIAIRTDAAIEQAGQKFAPAADRIAAAAGRVGRVLDPVVAPIRRRARAAERHALHAAASALERVSDSPLFQRLDHAVGAVRDAFLPEPAAEPPAPPAEPRP